MQSCYDCYLSKGIEFSNSQILDKKNKNNNQELAKPRKNHYRMMPEVAPAGRA